MARGVPPISQPAVRVRSIMLRATSAHVTWRDGPEPGGGRIPAVVLDDESGGLCGHLRAAEVEIADPAPVAVRERIRARVRLRGYAAFDTGGDVLHLRPHAVELESAGLRTAIAPDALRAARSDPLAEVEAAYLAHVAGHHGVAVRLLAGLIDARLRSGVRRVVPLALDRHGLTLRLEYTRAHRDVMLPFAEPADCPGEVRDRMAALLERAQRPASAGPRSLTALMRSGPAAARLCAPVEDDEE